MEVIYARNARVVRKLKPELEKKLNVKIGFVGNKISVEGNSLDEYSALKVLDAFNFGFSIKKALLLKQENFVFRKVHIKEFTKRNLKDIMAPLIWKNGKKRKTLSDISLFEVIVVVG